jgi:hypothetical protein
MRAVTGAGGGDGDTGAGDTAGSGGMCDSCIGAAGCLDGVLNHQPHQLPRGAPILAGQRLHPSPDLWLDSDRYRTKLVIHRRLLATARGCRRQQETRNALERTMPDTPKIIIDKDEIQKLTTALATELSASFNRKIEHLENRIEMLEQELETAHSRIRELEEALAVATSR